MRLMECVLVMAAVYGTLLYLKNFLRNFDVFFLLVLSHVPVTAYLEFANFMDFRVSRKFFR